MKKQVTYVDANKFENIIVDSGLECELKKGWVKVKGPKGRQVYVPRTKTVGRVDLSGFDGAGVAGVRQLDADESFGSVVAQLDFTRTEAEILGAFREVLELMKTLPEREARRRAGKRDESGAVGWSFMRQPAASSPPPAAEPDSSDEAHQ